MENLKEVLMRVKGMTEDRASQKIEEAKHLLAEGYTPEEVLITLYGLDAEELNTILTPDLHKVP